MHYLACFTLFDGDPGLINTVLDGFLAVTPEQIQDVARRYLVRTQRKKRRNLKRRRWRNGAHGTSAGFSKRRSGAWSRTVRGLAAAPAAAIVQRPGSCAGGVALHT
jgi:hypothetical protein